MKTILVIDDDESVRTALCHLVSYLGYRTLNAANGADGILLAKEAKPDLILCDVNMPEMDGHEVLKSLRKDPLTSSVPFVFLTGRGEREDLRKGMNNGADDYLTKPISLAELRNAISARLDRKEEIVNQYARELHRVEEKLQHISYFDQKTELPNELSLSEEFNRIIEAGKEEIRILSITIDRLKRFNSTAESGERKEFLSAVAQRFRNCLDNNGVVGRISEEEFATIMSGTEQEVRHYAHDLLQCIEEPFLIGTDEFRFTASIGIACYPADGKQFDELLGKASITSLRAAEEGGDQFLFFSASDSFKTREALVLEADLRKAIENDGLDLHFQPQIDVKTGEILGCEALIRWNHPSRGMISPITIISLAEQSGLIVSLGDWVLRKACSISQALNLNRKSHLRMAVNLSPCQFKRPDLLQRLMLILQDTGMQPQDLEIEVTESVLIHDQKSAYKRISELKSVGIHISLDDFGTGYSSLSYLKNFPFDSLKIDRSFIRDIQDDPANRAIVIAIIQMAKSLNLKIVAEGVETTAEFGFLYSYGCDAVQGFLLSPALPINKFETLINSTFSMTQFPEDPSVHTNI